MNKNLKNISVLSLLLGISIAGNIASADEGSEAAMKRNLSPEQQEAMQKKWESMTPEQQQAFKEQQKQLRQQYQNMSPEEQQAVKNNLNKPK